MKKDTATADRWQQVAQIYLAAAERDPVDREAFLREACEGDEGLRREVESLLCHEDGADALLERPAVALAAPMLDNSASSSLLVGRQIGPYTIVSWLGAGGMGEVYRARDASLKRDVALKTLPQSLAMDSGRLARFRREAEVLASLNHPNIAAIYGLEDADAIKALVMELVEGEDLAARIARGPIPLEEALPIAKQIGGALDAAHQSGIIHRDLKPANIKVRSDGTVKVLDFGLAKTVDAAAISGKLSDSPSLMPASATGQGVILGTAAYMAPEQARGQRVDKRADIWAFGVVLVEMLTGRPPFQGNDVTETIAAIVKTQPDLSGVPRVAQRLVGKCLEKDPALRLRDIGDAWELLAVPDITVPHNGSVRNVSLLRKAGVLLTIVALGLLVWLVRGNRELAPPQVTRFVDSLPEGRSMPYGDGISKLLALSRDGRALVYRAQDKGRFRLYRRFLDQPYAEPIGDDGAEEPFFSHDGQWVGYRLGTTLKRVPVRGGPAHTIVELPAEDFRGAHWTADGTIIVGGLSRGLWRVSERGGDIVTLGLATHGRIISDPQMLPGGRAILYTDGGADKPDDILQIYDLQNNTSKRLLPGAAGRYLPSGHLVYTSAGTLWAVRFELDRMEVRGTPTAVLEEIREHAGGGPGSPYGVSGIVHAVVAPTGVLAYIPEVDRQLRSTLVWVDREGREEPLGIEPGQLTGPRVSRDGTRVAFGRGHENDHDIWIWDVVGRTPKQLTFDNTWNLRHAWFPDGKRLAFSAMVNGINQVFMQSADGSGVPEQITEGPTHVVPTAFSPDGQLICAELYWTNDMNVDLALLTPRAPKSRRTLWQTPTTEVTAAISPNGRWLAYDSNHLGTFEIYVRPFPNVEDGEYKVTFGGGRNPVWGPGGRELFYLVDRGRMASVMAVSIVPGPGFDFKAPRPAAPGEYVRHGRDTPYDVAPDGRLLLLKPVGAAREEIVTVLNWVEELKRFVPTK